MMKEKKPASTTVLEKDTTPSKESLTSHVDTLVERALIAEQKYAHFTQEKVDKIVKAAALAGSEAALVLAHEAVSETKRGVVEDKDTKNRFATENVLNLIKDEKTVGVVGEDKIRGQVKIAAPPVSYTHLTLPTN